MKTALYSVKYAFAGFLVPFIFVYNPALLLAEGSTLWESAWVFLISCLSVIALASSIIGIFFVKLSMITRVLIALIALACIIPNIYINIISIIMLITIFIFNYTKSKRESNLGVKGIDLLEV